MRFTSYRPRLLFFFFNDTATTEIYTLSLHDALPIYRQIRHAPLLPHRIVRLRLVEFDQVADEPERSEEHTSELQSQSNLVCRLLLEKKKKKIYNPILPHPTIANQHHNTTHNLICCLL